MKGMSPRLSAWQLVKPGDLVGDRRWTAARCAVCAENAERAVVSPGGSMAICERCMRDAARALDADREGDSWRHPRHGIATVISIDSGRMWLGGARRAATREELVADGWERSEPPGAALMLRGDGPAATWHLQNRPVQHGVTIELLEGLAWVPVRFEWSPEQGNTPSGVRSDGWELTLRPTDHFRWPPRAFAQVVAPG